MVLWLLLLNIAFSEYPRAAGALLGGVNRRRTGETVR